ncbi:pentapeptide repeat-containing protein [Candidatus Methanomassiliicoccus intestinalis]|uniref:pentapeptide repeat-containing protein n=1 Tax=Candidatus Methanomassiliicoccus intestinalis TaxID=1406512 RepID=UPI0037DDD975
MNEDTYIRTFTPDEFYELIHGRLEKDSEELFILSAVRYGDLLKHEIVEITDDAATILFEYAYSSKRIYFKRQFRRGIEFNGDVLDLSHKYISAGEFDENLFFKDRETLEMHADFAYFESPIVLKHRTLSYSNFEYTIFKRAFEAHECTFLERADFTNSTFLGGAEFTGSKFLEDGEFRRSTFSWNTYFTNSEFSKNADFTSSRFLGDSNFTGSKITGNAKFIQSEFAGNTEFTDTRFSGSTNYHWSKFLKNADFTNSEFLGECNFTGTEFSGYASFFYSRFSEDVKFEAPMFSGDVSFFRSEFLKNCDFISSRFLGEVKFTQSIFSALADFTNSEYGGRANFRYCKFKGDARFTESNFRGDCEFIRSEFANLADFSSSKIINANIELPEPTDSKQNGNNLCFKNCTFEQISRIKGYGTIDITAAKIIGKLYLDWDYLNAKQNKKDMFFRKEKCGCRLENRSSGVFQILKENYRQLGQYDWEDEAYVEYKREKVREKHIERCKEHPRYARFVQKIRRNNERPYRPLPSLLDLVGEYGTNPKLVVCWMLIVPLIFAGVYYIMMQYGSGIELGNDGPTNPVHNVANALYLSSITFLTIGFSDMYPIEAVPRLFVIVEGFLGLFLMAYLTISFTRKTLR